MVSQNTNTNPFFLFVQMDNLFVAESVSKKLWMKNFNFDLLITLIHNVNIYLDPILQVGMTSSNLNYLTADSGIKWIPNSDRVPEMILLTRFQLSSTLGSIISRGLNFAIFRKNH